MVEQAQTAKRHAEVQEALAMLRVVKMYRHQIPTDKVQLGGDGTGLVDDFACLELAAALHRSVDSVTPQVVELVNLEVRLPRCWEITIACGIPVWLARRIARVTGDLTLRKALWVDATIAPFVTRLAPAGCSSSSMPWWCRPTLRLPRPAGRPGTRPGSRSA